MAEEEEVTAGPSQNTNSCKDCDEVFKSISSLTRHRKMVHPDKVKQRKQRTAVVIQPRSMADHAELQQVGIHVGDRILTVDGRPVFYDENLQRLMQHFKGNAIRMVVERPVNNNNKSTPSPIDKKQKQQSSSTMPETSGYEQGPSTEPGQDQNGVGVHVCTECGKEFVTVR